MLQEAVNADKNNNVFNTKSDANTDESKNLYLKNRRKNDALENLTNLMPEKPTISHDHKVFFYYSSILSLYLIFVCFLKVNGINYTEMQNEHAMPQVQIQNFIQNFEKQSENHNGNIM